MAFMKKSLVLGNFDMKNTLERIASYGATSVKVLDEAFRRLLLEEAKSYPYQSQEEIVGSGERIVRQQMQAFEDFPKTSKHVLLKDSWQAILERGLAAMQADPFPIRLHFNSMVLQRYEPGSLGITPHKDRSVYINLICIFVIGGNGRFYVCSDRSGSQAREISASPGHVILMQAPGLLGSTDRPFHYVSNITACRYVFGLRQRLESAHGGENKIAGSPLNILRFESNEPQGRSQLRKF